VSFDCEQFATETSCLQEVVQTFSRRQDRHRLVSTGSTFGSSNKCTIGFTFVVPTFKRNRQPQAKRPSTAETPGTHYRSGTFIATHLQLVSLYFVGEPSGMPSLLLQRLLHLKSTYLPTTSPTATSDHSLSAPISFAPSHQRLVAPADPGAAPTKVPDRIPQPQPTL
jgi:hypothetical protein